MAEDENILKRFFKGVYKAMSSPIGLLLVLVGYSFAGAAIFQIIESPHETTEKNDIIEMREEIIQNVLNNTALTQNRAQKSNQFATDLRDELKKYEAQLYAAFAHGINTDSEERVWDLWGSLIFCTTIYTTVGYGHIAPATDTGRIVTMVYGLIGIPLCLIVLAELGKFFTIVIKFFWSFIRRFYSTGHCKKVRKTVKIQAVTEAMGKVESKLIKSSNRPPLATEEVSEEVEEEEVEFTVDDEFNLPPAIAITITMLYILVGAVMYAQWEDWNYLESFYFIFISISTVGFGDVLPGNKKYFLYSFIYQLFGLALVAMVINVIMDVVQSTISKAKDKMVYATTSVGRKIGIPLGALEESERQKTD